MSCRRWDRAFYFRGRRSFLRPSLVVLSPKVRSFVDFLIKRFGGHPPWDAGIA